MPQIQWLVVTSNVEGIQDFLYMAQNTFQHSAHTLDTHILIEITRYQQSLMTIAHGYEKNAFLFFSAKSAVSYL